MAIHNNLISGTVPAAFAEIPTLNNLFVDGELSILKADFEFLIFSGRHFDPVFSRFIVR